MFNGFDLSTIQDVYVGGTGFSYIYYGSNLVWQKSAPYDEQYMTLEALEPGTFGITININNPAPTYYSLDNGTTWNEFISGSDVSVNTGDKMLLKRDVSAGTYSTSDHTILTSTANFNVYGNSQSMIYSDNFIGTTDFNHIVYAFSGLFKGNTHLIDASNLILPVMQMEQMCYVNMFYGCISLTTAPELPATTMGLGCYAYMFYDCISLTTAPELPATNLYTHIGASCYAYMFSGCTSLTTAPDLPATVLSDQCYAYMFQGCTSLTTTPELSATTLRNNCYQGMFGGCTSLTTAPALPATTLVESCYQAMFGGCTSINYIKCLATDISATDCTRDWVDGVAATGTFVKDIDMSSWTIGVNGIPTGWTTQNNQNYLGFRQTVGSTSQEVWYTTSDPSAEIYYKNTSTDTSWNLYTPGTHISIPGTNNRILFKGNGKIGKFHTLSGTEYNLVNVDGNIMSMIYGDNFDDKTTLTTNGIFYEYFSDCKIGSAVNLLLPATTLSDECYRSMFYGCSSLTTAPELPATTLSNDCYRTMFMGCSSLIKAPELPATILTDYCYNAMFANCTSLNEVKCYATDISATDCTVMWTWNVASSGTFYKDANTTWTTGSRGIPTGWQVIDN